MSVLRWRHRWGRAVGSTPGGTVANAEARGGREAGDHGWCGWSVVLMGRAWAAGVRSHWAL